MVDQPIEGQVLMLTAAKASVPPTRLPELLERAQTVLAPNRDRYRREHERLHATADRDVFLVDHGHWTEIGAAVGGSDRELSAIRRAHEEQLLRIGRRTGRESEFETALEIRDPVVIGTSGSEARSDRHGSDLE
ncbi:hypothetical protein [Natrinema sp. J7-2]|uniref:hypothetical protein n=1 Tax=Natrinema sp. (strain J7-2) TaxID=406552 RepID=UPI00026D49F8|nr:hypothetical protein [Natrinema sp. J7-2]AFO59206.1 hypothetical protein NJ7G_3992 [Natrinema sp. J7-2]